MKLFPNHLLLVISGLSVSCSDANNEGTNEVLKMITKVFSNHDGNRKFRSTVFVYDKENALLIKPLSLDLAFHIRLEDITLPNLDRLLSQILTREDLTKFMFELIFILATNLENTMTFLNLITSKYRGNPKHTYIVLSTNENSKTKSIQSIPKIKDLNIVSLNLFCDIKKVTIEMYGPKADEFYELLRNEVSNLKRYPEVLRQLDISLTRRPRRLENEKLTFVGKNAPPDLELKKDSNNNNFISGGVNKPLLDILQEKLRFRFSLLAPGPMPYGLYKNGSWFGLVGVLVREEADATANPLGFSYPRALEISYTRYKRLDSWVILTKAPEEKPKAFTFVNAFLPLTWAFIFISAVVNAVAINILLKFDGFGGLRKNNRRTSYWMWCQLRTILQQDLENFDQTTPIAICLTSWSFVSLVLIIAFEGLVFGILTVPSMEKPIDTLEQLEKAVTSHQIDLLMAKGVLSTGYIMEAETGSFHRIRRIVEPRYEELVRSSFEDLVREVRKGNKATFLGEHFIRILVRNKGYSIQDFHMSSSDSLVITVGFGLRSGFPWKQDFDVIIQRLTESGIMLKWNEDALREGYVQHQTSHKNAIYFKDVAYVFLMFLICLTISGTVFLMELIWKK